MKNYFEILGVPEVASKDEIKQAYKDLVKVWHPDRFSGDSRLQQKAQEKLKVINEAYDALIRTRPSQKKYSRPPSYSGASYASRSGSSKSTWFKWSHLWHALIGIFLAIILLGLAMNVFNNSISGVEPKNSMEIVTEN